MTRFGYSMLLRKQQMWVYVIGTLFVVDFFFYGYLPSHRRLQSLRRMKSQHARTIEAAASQEEMLPTLETRLDQAKATVKRYEGSIPSESALGVFLRQIAHIMAEHGLTDQEVIPSKETTAGELRCISVHMNCAGTLDGLFGFFRDLQGLGRLVRIEKATLKNDARFTGQVSMQTEAVIFYRPQMSQDNSADRAAVKVADNGA